MPLPPRPLSVPSSVWSRIGRNLHQVKSHPIGIVSNLIQNHFLSVGGFELGRIPTTPVVTTAQAFDNLLVPPNHVLRSKSDTFYVSEGTVLRPHATSHQKSVLADLRQGNAGGAVWTCDVYRKDEVDRTHFPVFHQTDGVKLFEPSVTEAGVVEDLQKSLKSLMTHLFDVAGRPLEFRWDKTATFPFTHPSMEMEIKFTTAQAGEHWVECLGCGKIRTELDPNGWAFGIGIDRMAMLLFEIDDIRTMWSEDPRFLSQFKEGEITKFKPFSKYPATTRDTAFWLPQGAEVNEETLGLELMRLVGSQGLEQVELVDTFIHPKTGRVSKCLRFTYRGIENTLTSEECNEIHSAVEQYITDVLHGQIR